MEYLAQLATLDLQSLLVLSLRLYFLCTSAAVLVVHFLPPLHKAFIPYGKTRRTDTQLAESILDKISGITVPKAWFWSYYFLSILLSVFWGFMFIFCSNGAEICLLPWLSVEDVRIWLVWGMMLIQGCRRLYESLCVLRPSSVRMWIGHYLAGYAFYIMMSMSVFAENTPYQRSTTLVSLKLTVY